MVELSTPGLKGAAEHRPGWSATGDLEDNDHFSGCGQLGSCREHGTWDGCQVPLGRGGHSQEVLRVQGLVLGKEALSSKWNLLGSPMMGGTEHSQSLPVPPRP